MTGLKKDTKIEDIQDISKCLRPLPYVQEVGVVTGIWSTTTDC